MHNKKDPTQLGRGEKTRQKVLEAALSVVREHPLADVQLLQIAERAGISSGHVLYHFGSKDQILVETLKWSEGAIAEQRAQELQELDEPPARLKRWIVLFLPHGADDPTWKLWLEFWLRSASREDLRAPSAISRSWMKDFDQVVEDGIGRGVFLSVDRDRFRSRTHAFLIGLSIGVLVGWQDLEEATRDALETVGDELGCVLLDRTEAG